MRFVFLFLLFLWVSPSAFAHSGGHTAARVTHAGEEGTDNISSGAMLNSPTASTLGRNHASAGFSFEYVRYNSIPAEDAHRLHHNDHDVHGKNHEEFYNMDFGYGVLNDLDLYLSAPIVNKNSIDIESHATLGRKENATGFGDMKLLAKYRFLKKFAEAALISGVKFPTGKTDDRRSNGAKFETENQPGSGSWDSEYGIVVSRSFWNRLSVATSFQFFLKTDGAQEHREGNSFRYSAGVSYALRDLGKHPNLSIVTELNNEWALKDKSRTEKHVFDSGGTTLYITPGLEADLAEHVSAFVAIPVPFYQNLGGEHEEKDFTLLTGVSFSY